MKQIKASLREKLGRVYSETTIEHIIRPHNADILPHPDGYGVSDSGCGERMKIWLRVRNGVVENTGFWTDGCAATVACGSMATDLVRGKTITEALAITAQDVADALVDLPQGNFHCAELAANTLRIALRDCLLMQEQPWKKLYRK